MDASLSPVISVGEAKELLKNEQVKFLDVGASVFPNFPDYKRYMTEYYGNFDKLIKEFGEQDYAKEHIPNAVSFSLNVGFCVGEFKRYDLYPPEMFEKYMKMLGVNNDDRVIVYGRGMAAGMLFAAHVWWALRHYGMKNVQVLNGGFEAWKAAGNLVSNKKAPSAKCSRTLFCFWKRHSVASKEGNFHAQIDESSEVTFEELKRIIDDPSETENVNLLDARPHEQYTGEAPMQLPTKEAVKGFHIKSAKCLPAFDLVDSSGMKPNNDLREILQNAGYCDGKPCITYCGVGNQGSLALIALKILGINNVKMFQGGMIEVARRSPESIC